jgi:hypothetical protein
VSDAASSAHDEWLGALAEAARLVAGAAEGAPPLDRAEGIRYVSRLATTALAMFVEHADPLHPTLYRNADEHRKFGVDNPDNVYLRCALDPAHSYRLRGTRGQAPYVGISIGADFYGGGDRRGGTLAQHELDAFEIAPDGSFELWLSAEPRPGNWIRLDAGATGMIVRQTFSDRGAERPAALAIERVGAAGPPPPLDPEALAAGLRRAAGFVLGSTRLFLRMAASWAERPNQLVGASGESTRHLHGDPDIFYAPGWWELAEDEALLVEVRPARRFLYWGFQLTNRWLESLDYRTRRVSLNHQQAERRADGSWRLVVAHADPGVPNWIDTAGHASGGMCFRWLLAEDDPPVPGVRVVKTSELAALAAAP